MYPEYQINNKIVGNQVLANAEMYNEVTEKQHGLRKHHYVGLLVQNKVLVGDIFCHTRRAGCYSMNNANGSFNHI